MDEEDAEDRSDIWESFRYFLGRWTGTGSGSPGNSQADREYKLILNDQFIQITHQSLYKPQERNPEGELHEELGYISYDGGRKLYVYREFHVEGYVNQYVSEGLAPGGQKLIFKTEAVENGPPGLQARTTYEILGENEFKETFDLAGPGQKWSCFITNDFKRLLND